MTKNIEELAVNTIRFLAVDAIEKARSGHPGLPMGGAPMAYTLWSRFLKHSPQDDRWINRDRFVLSAGHGSALLYALLHLFEYDLSLEDIKDFRQLGSKTPGHPEYGHTVGVETTTGPLGQGFANAVGMAMAEKRLAAEFNRPGFPIMDHYTYCYVGDGCLMEGIAYEAASLAGHLKLGKLICLYDDNKITIDGSTDLSFTEDIEGRFKACGWQVVNVKDGNDIDAVAAAIDECKKDRDRPSLIKIRTEIGFGSPNKQGKSAAHGAPLGEEEVRLTKENLGWPAEPSFLVPDEVREHFRGLARKLSAEKADWDKLEKAYRHDFPELAAQLDDWFSGEFPAEMEVELKQMNFDEPAATRAASGRIMQVLAGHLPNLMGGSADLNASVQTFLHDRGVFQPESPEGNNIYFGIREHAMAGILSGLVLHGGLRAFGSTFMVFCDYMKPSIRLAALMGIPLTYVFSHDSIAVGEDGPTHQPIEQLSNLRSIPNLTVLRPADGRETAMAWLLAVEKKDGPCALILSRQGLPQLSGTGEEALKGAYILKKEKGETPDLVLIASGSELHLALEAREILAGKNIDARVVSMMSFELFAMQTEEYREFVLPEEAKKRLAIEAALPLGWEPFVGDEGRVIGMNDFGQSAPGGLLLETMGFTVDNIVEQALKMMTLS
ncbi:MAG: transketolase [Firmicutes bacterium]|jgi:transketolase|nr:transketolase [Bacillota bacterium]